MPRSDRRNRGVYPEWWRFRQRQLYRHGRADAIIPPLISVTKDCVSVSWQQSLAPFGCACPAPGQPRPITILMAPRAARPRGLSERADPRAVDRRAGFRQGNRRQMLILVSIRAGDHPDGGPLDLSQTKKIFALSHEYGVDISSPDPTTLQYCCGIR